MSNLHIYVNRTKPNAHELVFFHTKCCFLGESKVPTAPCRQKPKRTTSIQLMRVYIQVRLGDGEVRTLDLPFVVFAGAVGDDNAEPSGALQDFAGDSPEIFRAVEGFQSVSAGLVDAGNHDGLDHVPGIAHLDHAPVFARAFLDPKRGGIAPHAIDAFAAHELPFAVIAAHEDSHDVGGGRAAQVHPTIRIGAAVGYADGHFFPAIGRLRLHMHAAATSGTALPRAPVVSRRHVHMDCRVILNIRLSVIAGAAEACLLRGNAPICGDGTLASILREFGVCRRVTVTFRTLAIVRRCRLRRRR